MASLADPSARLSAQPSTISRQCATHRFRKLVLFPSFRPPPSSRFDPHSASFSARVTDLLLLSSCSPATSTAAKQTGMRGIQRYFQSKPVQSDVATSGAREKAAAKPSREIELFDGAVSYDSNKNHGQTNLKKSQGLKQFFSPSMTSGLPQDEITRARTTTKDSKKGESKETTHPITVSAQKDSPTQTFQISNKKTLQLTIDGIELFCRNASASEKALRVFKQMCTEADTISVAFVFRDGTTTHVETSVRHCTPSRPCHAWYCACDRHIRARQGMSSLLGAAFCIGNQEDVLYFLSLSDDLDIQMNCTTSIKQRWEAFIDIVLCNRPKDGNAGEPTKKVVFNVQVFLAPMLYYLKLSEKQPTNVFNNNANSLFDVKLASHMLNPDLSEEELELQSICDRCKTSPCTSVTLEKQFGSVTKILHCLLGELQCLLHSHEVLMEDLRKKNLVTSFNRIEMPIGKQLADMELRGFRVISKAKMDLLRNNLKAYEQKLEQKAQNILSEDDRIRGKEYPKPFNLSSPKQVAHVLFSVLGLSSESESAVSPSKSYMPSTARGSHPSTSEEDLLVIKDKHPLVEIVLAYRYVSKLLHTFVEGIQPFIVNDNESTRREISSNSSILSKRVQRRIYATWNQTSTRTGRFSCQKPNLQAFPNPKRLHVGLDKEVDVNVRSIFTASDGGILVSADYSQIEMRILAHLCGDEAMIDLFNVSDVDIYEMLARIVLNKKPGSSVSSTERERAKVICLGTIYGMGLPSAAAKLSISTDVAKSILNSFYSKFKRVRSWIQNVKSEAKKKGFVATLGGRKRFLPNITSSDSKQRSQAERQAINSVVQGSASDVIKHAMLSVDKALDCHPTFGHVSNKDSSTQPMNPFRPCLVSQIHDELIYDLQPHKQKQNGDSESLSSDTHVKQFMSLLRECLEETTRRILKIKVSLKVKITIGENWGNMLPPGALEMHGKMDLSAMSELPLPQKECHRHPLPVEQNSFDRKRLASATENNNKASHLQKHDTENNEKLSSPTVQTKRNRKSID